MTEDKKASLFSQIAGCKACNLRREAKTPVLPEGQLGKKLFIVGRNPGEEEDAQGKPFVGSSGSLLDKMLGMMEVPKDQTWITNLCKCHSSGNREPTYQEITACHRWLIREIFLMRPLLIVALGAQASESLLGLKFQPSGMVSREYAMGKERHRCFVIMMYHPGFVLRSPDEEEKYKVSWTKIGGIWRKLNEEKPPDERSFIG